MIRTVSNPEECYFDRNLLIQAYAKELMNRGVNVFLDHDESYSDYILICIQLNDQHQLTWHIPTKELVIDIPERRGFWKPMDISERRKLMLLEVKAHNNK